MKTEIIKSIEPIIEEADRMKNAYFWTPDGCAGGHHYSAEYTVSCSCKYVYAIGRRMTGRKPR